MQASETYREKRYRLKKAFLSRAINENRGADAIQKLNALYRNVRATMAGTDDDVVSRWSIELSKGNIRATLSDLQIAASDTQSRLLNAFNVISTLSGTGPIYRETHIMPASPTLQ
jgi:hypothetical protein